MITVRRFRELDNSRREALFAFIQRLGGSRWFSTYDEMTGNYGSQTFAGGVSHLSAWNGEEPAGALGVITATTIENGEAMLVSPYLAPDAEAAFLGLLEAAAHVGSDARASRLTLQLDERTAWARGLAERQGYSFGHESLTLRYTGGDYPALPAGFTVTRLSPDDAEVYARIDHDAFIDSPNGVPITVSDLMAQMDEPGMRFFLGRWQGEPVAAAELWLRDDDGWIQSLGVMPQFQGRGFGRAMLRHAVSYLRESGFATIRLGVMSANPRALQLYLSEGFVRERVSAVWLVKHIGV